MFSFLKKINRGRSMQRVQQIELLKEHWDAYLAETPATKDVHAANDAMRAVFGAFDNSQPEGGEDAPQ